VFCGILWVCLLCGPFRHGSLTIALSVCLQCLNQLSFNTSSIYIFHYSLCELFWKPKEKRSFVYRRSKRNPFQMAKKLLKMFVTYEYRWFLNCTIKYITNGVLSTRLSRNVRSDTCCIGRGPPNTTEHQPEGHWVLGVSCIRWQHYMYTQTLTCALIVLKINWCNYFVHSSVVTMCFLTMQLELKTGIRKRSLKEHIRYFPSQTLHRMLIFSSHFSQYTCMV